MARINAYRTNVTGPGATNTIATGPGGIHTIICTSNSTTPATITLYDNTTAGTQTLILIYISAYAPFIFNSKDIAPLRFNTGLTVTCGANCTCFVVTEQ